MSLECSECERDLRGGHDPSCSRYKPSKLDEHLATCKSCSINSETGYLELCSTALELGAEFEEA